MISDHARVILVMLDFIVSSTIPKLKERKKEENGVILLILAFPRQHQLHKK